jgi:hypothetical protein
MTAAVAANNQSQEMAVAKQSVPRLRGLARQSGVPASTSSALTQLADSLQAFANGARGPDVSARLSAASNSMTKACM